MTTGSEEDKTYYPEMLKVIYSLPDQIKHGLGIEVGLKEESGNIVVAGVGGSAITGDILRVWLEQSGRTLHVIRDSNLPKWVEEDEVLICISYSGNTSEALECLNEGLRRKCRILCVTTGGKMRDICESEGVPVTCIPEGLPPRGGLGYLFAALARAVMDDRTFMAEMEKVIRSLNDLREKLVSESERNLARDIAQEIVSLYPLIYADRRFLPIARRWKTQLNENSKKHAWFGSFPEINHNEIVGWDMEEGVDRFCAIFLRDDETSPRMKLTIGEIGKKTETIEVKAEGESLLSRMFYVLMMGDFVSYYCAEARGLDPIPVDAIQRIKDSF
jgi:glucose/mannose-6-phosphate isomerase